MILRNFQDLFWIGFQKWIEGWFFRIWSGQSRLVLTTGGSSLKQLNSILPEPALRLTVRHEPVKG